MFELRGAQEKKWDNNVATRLDRSFMSLVFVDKDGLGMNPN